MIAKRKKLYSTDTREKLVLSFYKAFAGKLTFSRVKTLKKLAYSVEARDYIVYDWARTRDFSLDEIIMVRKALYSIEARDRLILSYVKKNHGRLDKNEIELLRKLCYQMEYRDEITMEYL